MPCIPLKPVDPKDSLFIIFLAGTLSYLRDWVSASPRPLPPQDLNLPW